MLFRGEEIPYYQVLFFTLNECARDYYLRLLDSIFPD